MFKKITNLNKKKCQCNISFSPLMLTIWSKEPGMVKLLFKRSTEPESESELVEVTRSVKKNDVKRVGFKGTPIERSCNFQVAQDGTTEKKTATLTVVRSTPDKKFITLGRAEIVLTDYMTETTLYDEIILFGDKSQPPMKLRFSICLTLENEKTRDLLKNAIAKSKHDKELSSKKISLEHSQDFFE